MRLRHNYNILESSNLGPSLTMEMVFYHQGNRRYIVNDDLLDDSVKDGVLKRYLEEGSEGTVAANPGKNSSKHSK